MAIRMEKEGNNKQMLIYMNRMDLMWGSRGKDILRSPYQVEIIGISLICVGEPHGST